MTISSSAYSFLWNVPGNLFIFWRCVSFDVVSLHCVQFTDTKRNEFNRFLKDLYSNFRRCCVIMFRLQMSASPILDCQLNCMYVFDACIRSYRDAYVRIIDDERNRWATNGDDVRLEWLIANDNNWIKCKHLISISMCHVRYFPVMFSPISRLTPYSHLVHILIRYRIAEKSSFHSNRISQDAHFPRYTAQTSETDPKQKKKKKLFASKYHLNYCVNSKLASISLVAV